MGTARNDVAVRTDELDQLDREINRARSGPPEAYAEVLERAVAACQRDAQAAKYLIDRNRSSWSAGPSGRSLLPGATLLADLV